MLHVLLHVLLPVLLHCNEIRIWELGRELSAGSSRLSL